MAELSTRQKIVCAAIRLFNEFGMANVRLQQIANEVGISAGNLAYHFRNKEAILEAVKEEVHQALGDILSAYRLFPNLIDFDHQLTQYFEFLEKYPFYFMDLLEIERNYPDLPSPHRTYISKMISQIRKRFDYNLQRGLIIPESRPGQYDSTANAIWMLITFWAPLNLLRGKWTESSICTFKEAIWNQIYPLLTEAGRLEFEQLIVPILEQHTSDN